MNAVDVSSQDLCDQLCSYENLKEKENCILDYLKAAENETSITFGFDKFNLDEDWLNSLPLTNDLIQEKLVLVDFFTYCCINCIHMIPFLHDMEKKFSVKDGLVVVGVHCAKFPNEKSSTNIQDFLNQYNIEHPVLNDADCVVWNEFGIQCWPSFLLISPSGKVLLLLAGESHSKNIELIIKTALQFYKDSLSSHDIPKKKTVIRWKNDEILQYPAKLEISPSGEVIAITDASKHCIYICNLQTGMVEDVVGTQNSGHLDGSFHESSFNSPQGVCWINDQVFYVADCGNNLIRKVDRVKKDVETVAGNLISGSDRIGGKKGLNQEISSPWDLQLAGSPNDVDSNKVLFIAMAGSHQIWALILQKSSWFSEVSHDAFTCLRFVGSGNEENRNNSYPHRAGLAQPSGLTFDPSSHKFFVADSESSTIRKIDLKKGSVEGVVGGAFDPTDLFAFGDCDGVHRNVKLQHPMAVVWDRIRSCLYVADTFNNKIKLVLPEKKLCTTLCGPSAVCEIPKLTDLSSQFNPLHLNHPSGLCIDKNCQNLYIADSNNHRVMVVNLQQGTSHQFKVVLPTKPTLPSKPMFKSTSKVRRLEEDVLLVAVDGNLQITFDMGPKKIQDASFWQLGFSDSKDVDDGTYVCLATDHFKVDDHVVVDFNCQISELLVKATDFQHPIFLCFESTLYVCSGESCKIEKVALAFSLKPNIQSNTKEVHFKL